MPRGRGIRQVSWQQLLEDGHRPVRVFRFLFGHLPSEPRCKLCVAPFGGIGGRLTRVVGFGPSRMNPNFCANCLEVLPPGGAEVHVAVLFADVRGSTPLGESSSATAFATLMNRFYALATKVVVTRDGLIDKLIGDEVMALFLPGFAGADYRQKACDAGVALLMGVASDPALSAALSIGVGLHAGLAYVGNVGGEGVFDFTALGDTVNLAARLQAEAGPSELVVSDSLYDRVTLPATEQRLATIKGKADPVSIHVARF